MNNTLKKLTCLMISFLAIGCSQGPASTDSSKNQDSSKDNSQETSENTSSSNDKSSSKSSSSAQGHVHEWETEWSYDDNGHFHACKTCNAKKDITAHKVSSDWESVNLGEYLQDDQYRHSTVKMKRCSDCGYNKLQDADVFPRVKLYFDKNDPDADFATKATSMDTDRPELAGTLTIDNCADTYKVNGAVCKMKVRGNQTAGFPKKGLRIKLDVGANLLGLNNGKKFKKWVLMADAKDSCIIRTAIGLSTSRAISVGEKIFVSDFTPVSVYLNDEYWGYYYLAEQKETKKGRIDLTVPDGYTGIDIGYNFELDHYASGEKDKVDGGDPTFTISYHGYGNNDRPYNIENSLANPGLMRTFTMNSDIFPEVEGVHRDETNNEQVKFIKERVEALFTVLYEGVEKKRAYEIVNDTTSANFNKAVPSSKSVEQCIKDNFDLDTWACGFIINGFSCPPDLGYSSFYMSFDNTATGEKKLRYDNPWDFDSNFGNRNNFITSADSASSSGWGSGFDPYYLDRTSNMWLQLLGKLDFFMNVVKEKWNQARENQVFEKMFRMMRVYFKYYDYEARKNFTKWPEIKASDSQVGQYFSGELRDIFKDPKNRIEAQAETINWCSKRVNYLEGKWGNKRPAVDTGA